MLFECVDKLSSLYCVLTFNAFVGAKTSTLFAHHLSTYYSSISTVCHVNYCLHFQVHPGYGFLSENMDFAAKLVSF